MAENPILTYLPLNGTLAGRDRLTGSFSATATGAIRWQPAEGARINFIPNSRAAVNSTGWGGQNNTTVTREVDSMGFTYFKVVNTGGIAYAQMIRNTAQASFRPRALGLTYTVSFDAKLISGYSGCNVSFRGLTAAGGYVTNVASTLKTFTDTWTRYSITVTPTTALLFEYWSIDFANTTTAAHEWYITNIVVEEGTIVNPTYFDGGYSNCSWFDWQTGQLGTAWASYSCNQLTAWVEEGTTNLWTNPSAEVDVSLVSKDLGANATITRDTANAYLGSACFKFERVIVGLDQYMYNTTAIAGATAGDTYTISCYVKTNNNSYIGIRLGCYDVGGAFVTYVTQASCVITSNVWTRYTFTATVPAGATTQVRALLWISSSAAYGASVNGTIAYIDCIQVEKKANVTSYTDGTMGTGYSWSGTAHASSSIRANTYITLPTIGSGIKTDTSYIMTKICNLTGSGNGNRWYFNWGGYGTEDFFGMNIAGIPGTMTMGTKAGAGADRSTSGPSNVPIGAYRRAHGFWSLTDIKLWVEGTLYPQTRLLAPVGTTSAAPVYLGCYQGGQQANVGLGPFAMFSRELTNTERTAYDAAMNAYTDLWSVYAQQIRRMNRTSPSTAPTVNQTTPTIV